MNDGQESKSPEVEPQSDLGMFLESIGLPLETVKGVASLMGVFAIIGLVAIGISWHKAKKQSEQEMFSQAVQEATNPSDLGELISENKDQPAAPVAILKLAGMQFMGGNYALAQATYSQFMKDFPDHSQYKTAQLGVIVCTESQGLIKEAMVAYSEFIEKNPDHFRLPDAVFGQARCLEMFGQLEEASQIYEEFIVDNEDSVWADLAESKLDSVKIKLKRAQGTL